MANRTYEPGCLVKLVGRVAFDLVPVGSLLLVKDSEKDPITGEWFYLCNEQGVNDPLSGWFLGELIELAQTPVMKDKT